MFAKKMIRSGTSNDGVKIVYDDVAPYAKENSNPQIVDAGLYPQSGLRPRSGLHPRKTMILEEFPDLVRDDVTYPGYSLCLPGFAWLNGEYNNFPDDPGPYGYISQELSEANRRFNHTEGTEGLKPSQGLLPRHFLCPSTTYTKTTSSPVLTITLDGRFTSVGLLLSFNMLSGDYCSMINIKWFRDGKPLSNIDFHPNSTRYFCSNYVQNYDKIVIIFIETSKPYRPVFLTRVDYGIYRDFMGDELVQTDCLQEINAISENISINTLDFTVRTRSDIPFDMQKKQRLQLYFNGNLLGNFYIKNGARKNKTDYHIGAHDAIGVLEGNEYAGGIYTGQTVSSVIAAIFEGEDYNYLLAGEFADVKLYGYIPYTSKRNALVQIAFAIGAVVDTSNYDGVVIYPQQTEVSGVFDGDSSFEGVTLEQPVDIVTGIRLFVHSFAKTDETQEIYNEILNGTAEVMFSEPYHSLIIEGGAIGSYGDNFAYITGTGGIVKLTGKKYNHVVTSILKENPDIIFNKNIKEVKDSTLIHSGNANSALERIYQYYQRAESVRGSILLGDKMIGQVVEIDTGYDGKRTGTIESIDYSFSDREVRAEVVIHE